MTEPLGAWGSSLVDEACDVHLTFTIPSPHNIFSPGEVSLAARLLIRAIEGAAGLESSHQLLAKVLMFVVSVISGSFSTKSILRIANGSVEPIKLSQVELSIAVSISHQEGGVEDSLIIFLSGGLAEFFIIGIGSLQPQLLERSLLLVDKTSAVLLVELVYAG